MWNKTCIERDQTAFNIKKKKRKKRYKEYMYFKNSSYLDNYLDN